MKKITITLLLLCSFVLPGVTQNRDVTDNPEETIATFKFLHGKDMFFVPYGGNDVELSRLFNTVERFRKEITSGEIYVHVNGYSASMPTAKENLRLAFIRSNRVKSELITRRGLLEEHFRTKNHTEPYEGHKNIVIVTLRYSLVETHICVSDSTSNEDTVIARTQSEAIQQENNPQENLAVPPRDQENPAVPHGDLAAAPCRRSCPFVVRTNLLYDAFLTPTLGIEWRLNHNLGVKLDGSYAYWGNEHGRVQKLWMLSPEVRWYMGAPKRLYLGAAANFGEYNIYKGMIGSMFPDDKGYQGDFWNAGLTAGYQLPLSRHFALDFNIGLGYTRYQYDSFTVADRRREFVEKGKTKNFWGPTQAGISLIWVIGGMK